MRPSFIAALGGAVPTTLALTYAQMDGGNVRGVTDTARTAGRVYWAAGRSYWAGSIKGTSAAFTATAASSPSGLVEVSVDGGAYAAAAQVAGVYTLFSGLADTDHTVLVRFAAAYGVNSYCLTTGNVLACTGIGPAIRQRYIAQPYDLTGNVAWSCAFYTPGGVFGNPGKESAFFGVNTTAGSAVPCVRFRCSATQLFVLTSQAYVFVSVDGAAPTRYATGYAASTPKLFTVPATYDGTAHNYSVWAPNVMSTSGVFGVYADAPPVTLSTAGRLDQFGDSITRGAGSTSPGDVETMSVAANLGYVGSTYGVDGNTVAALQARMASALLIKDTDVSKDVAIIAIGRNDAVWDAAAISNYTDIINQLLVKYKTIICRGVLPEGANLWPTQNNGISALVTSLANARVKWLDTSAWSGIATADGVHPTDAGYVTIRGYAVAAYPALL